MNVRVLKAGAFDSIQDLGRHGFQFLGINPGGSMDKVATSVANILAGNDMQEAVIEMHFPAPALLIEQDVVIALSGADFGATLNDQPVPLNVPVVVKNYSFLQFTRYRHGARCYLAVHGGFDIPKWLNSYATNFKAGAGGYHGSCLKKDAELPIKKAQDYSLLLKDRNSIFLPWKADVASLYAADSTIRICNGAAYDQLTRLSKHRLTASSYIISDQSDRMGYRLIGAALERLQADELISTAVTAGTIQLLPNGQLIVLMSDHQTTGGYPVIAHVISADIPSLAQLPSNKMLRFQLTDHDIAEDLLFQQDHYLQVLENASRFRWSAYFN